MKCKNVDIPDAPESSFRRWKKKEMVTFDCEPTKDTSESSPIRGGGNGIEQCDGDGEGGGGGGGNGDDDSMDDDEHDNEVLEENRSGPEEEEEEEQQDPFQQDHVEVTDLFHLLNRSVTPPLPPKSD